MKSCRSQKGGDLVNLNDFLDEAAQVGDSCSLLGHTTLAL